VRFVIKSNNLAKSYKEEIINHIQDITQNINNDNINETITGFTSLINNLFSCIDDILNPKKNPLMRNILIIPIIKKIINKIFDDLLDIISNIKEKIVQLFINIQSIDTTKIEKSITSINDIFKNICIIIDNIIKLSYKSALLILLYPIVSICIGICSLMILSIVFMISALNLLNYQKLQLTISNVKTLFNEFFNVLTKLKSIAICIILLAPLMALAILASPLVLIELYIFTFIIKALVYIINLIKVREINNIQFMLLDDNLNLRWYLIGDGEEKENLEYLIKKNNLADRIILLGTIVNPYPYFKECDIYVQPSRHEGYCITLAEARLFNKAIVTTDSVGAKEQIVDGETGLIVKFDKFEIYNAIKKIIENKQLGIYITDNLKKDNLIANSNDSLRELLNI
jgi:glycosyltransferase involved in cell wall biosynthesis